jgi:aminoglycoside phosphotransferase family enzyme
VPLPETPSRAAEEITMTSRGRTDRGADDSLPQLVSALRDGACYDHPTDTIVVLETHISYVLLTGSYAYKIKKPVSLPFLDFSTLEFRKHYCDEELRINRRLASELYLDVVPITGTPRAPRMNGDGRAIEYAVKMVQFPDADRLDRVADRGELDAAHIKALAEKIATFHENVAVADRNSQISKASRRRRCLKTARRCWATFAAGRPAHWSTSGAFSVSASRKAKSASATATCTWPTWLS